MNGAAGGKCHNKTYKLNTLSAAADVDGVFAFMMPVCAILLAMAREKVLCIRESIYFSLPDDFLFNRRELAGKYIKMKAALCLYGTVAVVQRLICIRRSALYWYLPRCRSISDCPEATAIFSVIYAIGKLFFCDQFLPSCTSLVHFPNLKVEFH